MALSDLLCVLEATDRKNSEDALKQALALAQGYKAQASVLVTAPEVLVAQPLFDVSTATEIVAQENARVREQAQALANEAKEAIKQAGLSADANLDVAPFAEVRADVRRRARARDLTVLGRPGGALERSEVLFEEVLFESGRPVLLATSERGPVSKVGCFAVAWDGSIHAARALALALGLFPDAKNAHIIVVSGDKDLSQSTSGKAIAAHIERHGMKAQVVERKADKSGAAAAIDAAAAECGCDIVVLGGFGRSRLREFVLGGVTRELSRTAKTALLFAH